MQEGSGKCSKLSQSKAISFTVQSQADVLYVVGIAAILQRIHREYAEKTSWVEKAMSVMKKVSTCHLQQQLVAIRLIQLEVIANESRIYDDTE